MSPMLLKIISSLIPLNLRLLDLVKNPKEREWYIHRAVEHGWSRNVLVHQIESNLYERQGKALTNFSRTLPAVQSEDEDPSG